MEDIKEKSADEMFEELEFELIKTREDYIEYFKSPKKTNHFGKNIFFHTDIKGAQMHGCFTAKELKAINKKIEELGW